MIKKKYIGLGLIVFVLICFFIVKLFANQEQNEENLQDDERIPVDGGNTLNEKKTNCPPVFNYEFTDFSKIDAFQPIGSIAGASRGRSYITIKAGESVPVYAPMDATLVSIIYAYRGPESDHGEYGLKFNAGCSVNFLLDHLDSISDEIKKYAPIEPSRSTATNDVLSIPIKGGTLLGYTDGTPQARTFDFLVLDETKKAFYINPDRWQWGQSLYSVCPYDLYESVLKEKYYQKIGVINYDGFEKAETCGNPSYDIENTISGGWFLDEKATDIHGEFMLIGEAMGRVDLAVKTESEGTKLRITDSNTEKFPREIGIGESICYTGFNSGWAYLNLVDAKTIELANGQGNCPSSFPATGSKKYYR